MEWPSSEIEEWRKFFAIYPFAQDREDSRAAMIATIITNMSGKQVKRPVKPNSYMPDFLKPVKTLWQGKSLEEQKADWAAFIARYRSFADGNKIRRRNSPTKS